jgi:hypothetical protein
VAVKSEGMGTIWGRSFGQPMESCGYGDVARVLIPGMRPDDVVNCTSSSYQIPIISYHIVLYYIIPCHTMQQRK